VATVNFSVPDEVKEAINKAFGDQNKSSIIAELMRRAVRERHLKIRRENFDDLKSCGEQRFSRSKPTVICLIRFTTRSRLSTKTHYL